MAADVNNIGLVLMEQGDLPGARARFERALEIGEAAYGPDHPDLAKFVQNLANVLQRQGDSAGARALLERALDIFRRFLGDDHPYTLTVKEILDSLKD